MRKHLILVIVVALLGGYIAGCSGGGAITAPEGDDMSAASPGGNSHQIWGLWQFVADPANETLDTLYQPYLGEP